MGNNSSAASTTVMAATTVTPPPPPGRGADQVVFTNGNAIVTRNAPVGATAPANPFPGYAGKPGSPSVT